MNIEQQQKLDSLIIWHNLKCKKLYKMADQAIVDMNVVQNHPQFVKDGVNERVFRLRTEAQYHQESSDLLHFIKNTYYDR